MQIYDANLKIKKIHWKTFAREFEGLIKSICTYNQIRAARDKLDIYVYQLSDVDRTQDTKRKYYNSAQCVSET